MVVDAGIAAPFHDEPRDTSPAMRAPRCERRDASPAMRPLAAQSMISLAAMGYANRPPRSLSHLAQSLGGLFGFVGWATVALGLVPLGPLVGIAAGGALASFLQERTFWPSLVAETFCWAVALTVVSGPSIEWVAAGGAVAAAARGAAWTARRYAERA